MDTSLNSSLLDAAVAELAKLPGIGRKTALRLATSIIDLRNGIRYCRICHNISETDVCPICADNHRDRETVCVVENVKDVITIEATHEHRGVYHVLGGLISPLDGVSPSDLEIDSLVSRVRDENVKEVILALSPTMEGDTTSFYIYRKLSGIDVSVTVLARGLSIGNELEYTDELTLGRSILNRTPFNSDED